MNVGWDIVKIVNRHLSMPANTVTKSTVEIVVHICISVRVRVATEPIAIKGNVSTIIRKVSNACGL